MSPLLATVILFVVSTGFGIGLVRRIVTEHESRHELRHGSAGFLRAAAGWGWVCLWLGLSWYLASIIGDWSATGDLEGAINRDWLRRNIRPFGN
jgi:hypothetical protein